MAGRAKKDVDWDAIETDYRAGIKTLRKMGEEHGIANNTILKRAKTRGWDRDLSARIQLAADARVSKAQVSEEVSKQRIISEKEIVEANAEAIARVIEGSRKQIANSDERVKLLHDKFKAAEYSGAYELGDLTDIHAKLTAAEKVALDMRWKVWRLDAVEKAQAAASSAVPDAINVNLTPSEAYLKLLKGE